MKERKREVWIAPGQDRTALNTGVLAVLRFADRLSRGRDYAAGSVLDAIRKAENRDAAAEAVARAWGRLGPSLSTLGKWRRALDARWPDLGLAILALAAQAAAAAPYKPAAEKKEGA
jgi:hypothetical protein